jgi:triacylglycerol esterase/lipase EstA (alpha/beta hydrolase family)
VLVPGYGGNTTGLGILAAALQKDDRFTKVVDLGPASVGDLSLQADIVDDAVEDTLAESGAEKVDIVSFSAGGIAVRLWMDAHDGASITRRVVTLSAPNHGTEVSLMRSLAEHDKTPTGPTWVPTSPWRTWG